MITYPLDQSLYPIKKITKHSVGKFLSNYEKLSDGYLVLNQRKKYNGIRSEAAGC
jgi:hypothetical protein